MIVSPGVRLVWWAALHRAKRELERAPLSTASWSARGLQAIMLILKAGILYFALVFAAGFVLGTMRAFWVVPHLGDRTAELVDMPLMLMVMMVAARWIVRRLGVPSTWASRLGMGGVALVLLLAAEWSLGLWLRGLSIGEYVASRDPVAGTVYLLMLGVFALLPRLVARRGAEESMSPNRFTQFADQKYLNLETYRRTGVPVTTPVWFAEEHGTLYIYSLANAGKVKRIRHHRKVTIVPCDVHGHPKGEWVEAEARILAEAGAARGHQLLNQKYGWIKRLGDVVSRLRHRERVVIAIDLV